MPLHKLQLCGLVRVSFWSLVCIALLCSCEQKPKVQWSKFGKTLNEWTRGEVERTDSLYGKRKYHNGSEWEFVFNDIVDSLPLRVCWMAPDMLDFDLRLNGRLLIKNDASAIWPSSFSADSIFIYPNDWAVRPYVINVKEFVAACRPGKNKLVLSLRSGDIQPFDDTKCGLFIFSTDIHNEKQTPAFSSQLYQPAALPRLNLSTTGNRIDQHERVKAVLSIDCDHKVYCECSPLRRDVMIRTRGFASSNFPKKQYSIHVQRDTLQKEKIGPLEMGKARKWILQGPYGDTALIRNAFVYQMWRDMGYWSAESRFVELVLDNSYQGVYLLMERVEISASRLDLEIDTADADAYLVQLDRPERGDAIVSVGSMKFIISDPPGAALTGSYAAMIESSLSQKFDALKSPLRGDAVDWNSFADFMLVQEFVKNIDAYDVSTFFHKDSDSKNGSLIAGPVWDFDVSCGNSITWRAHLTEGWIWNSGKPVPRFWKELHSDPAFMERLNERYWKLRSASWSEMRITEVIDSLSGILGDGAAQRNQWRFPFSQQAGMMTHRPYPDQIAILKSWLHRRMAWLDGYFEQGRPH